MVCVDARSRHSFDCNLGFLFLGVSRGTTLREETEVHCGYDWESEMREKLGIWPHPSHLEDRAEPQCLLTRDRRAKDEHNLFWVRVMDHSQKWHTYRIHVAGDLLGELVSAEIGLSTRMYPTCEDQGWVCFATGMHLSSKKKKAPPSFYFNVVNPLTRSSHELPPLVNYTKLNLMKIHVNRATTAVKVFAYANRVV